MNDVYLINVEENQDIIGIKENEGYESIYLKNPMILFKNNFGIALRKLPYIGDGNYMVISNYNYIYKLGDKMVKEFYYGKVNRDVSE